MAKRYVKICFIRVKMVLGDSQGRRLRIFIQNFGMYNSGSNMADQNVKIC